MSHSWGGFILDEELKRKAAEEKRRRDQEMAFRRSWRDSRCGARGKCGPERNRQGGRDRGRKGQGQHTITEIVYHQIVSDMFHLFIAVHCATNINFNIDKHQLYFIVFLLTEPHCQKYQGTRHTRAQCPSENGICHRCHSVRAQGTSFQLLKGFTADEDRGLEHLSLNFLGHQ